MSGRFALTATPDEVAALFGLGDLEDFPPRYNIAPTQPILLVMAGPRRDRGSNLPDRRALLVRWGLIPGWAKNPAELPLHVQRALRDGRRKGLVPGRHAPPPRADPGVRLLRMETQRRRASRSPIGCGRGTAG